MNELFEEVNKITDSGAEFHIFKFKYTQKWSCTIERKDDGINLKITEEGFDCPEAIGTAVDKWLRITAPIKEFSVPVLEHIRPAPAPNELDDEIPF